MSPACSHIRRRELRPGSPGFMTDQAAIPLVHGGALSLMIVARARYRVPARWSSKRRCASRGLRRPCASAKAVAAGRRADLPAAITRGAMALFDPNGFLYSAATSSGLWMKTRAWYAVGVAAHEIPDRIAPGDDELAVLSLLASRCDGTWRVVCGSLLSVPIEQAWMSWRRWAEREPGSRQRRLEPGVDAGPVFTVDPFPGLRAVRAVAGRAAWDKMRSHLRTGRSASTSPATPSRRSPGRRRSC